MTLTGLNSLPGNCRQLLYCKAKSPDAAEAELTLWEKTGGNWVQAGESIPAVVGKNGLALGHGTSSGSPAFGSMKEKEEGDGRSPVGIWPLGKAFGYAAEAPSAWPYLQLTDRHIAVDDPHSRCYNCILDADEIPGPDWQSVETMLRPDGLYAYGLVIEYNTRPAVAGKGSCIFLHLWRGPGQGTEGCVAMQEDDMLRILRWLDRDKNPVIRIGL